MSTADVTCNAFVVMVETVPLEVLMAGEGTATASNLASIPLVRRAILRGWHGFKPQRCDEQLKWSVSTYLNRTGGLCSV